MTPMANAAGFYSPSQALQHDSAPANYVDPHTRDPERYVGTDAFKDYTPPANTTPSQDHASAYTHPLGQRPRATRAVAIENDAPSPPASTNTVKTTAENSCSCKTQSTVNARDALERIAREWEAAGRNPEAIALVRADPNRWINSRSGPERLVILEIAKALDSKGELQPLREQAIRFTRTTDDWRETLDARVAKEPAVSRDEHEKQLLEKHYGWQYFSPEHNVYVLGLIIHLNRGMTTN